MSNEYKITKTNPEGTKTRWSVQRVSKTNQPIGKAEIFSTEDAAKRYVAGKQSTVEESRMSSIMKGILSESGEPVSVIYIDGKPSVKYTNIDDARAALKLMQDKHPKKKIEIKSEVRESGYGQSQRKYKAKPAGQIEEDSVLAETKMSDIVKPLIRAFNLEHGGSEKWADMIPLHSKSSMKRWRRGDGSYYKDPNSIVAFDQSDPEQRKLEGQFFKWLSQQPGVQPAGKIRGEFRSSDYADAVKYKGLIFISRGSFTEYTTPSRLRNSDVWHHKADDNTGEIQDESSIMKGLTT